MGFLEALMDIGSVFVSGDMAAGGLEKIYAYANLIGDPQNTVLVRVFLDIPSKDAEVLDVRGVSNVDIQDLATLGSEEEIKRLLPYVETAKNSSFQLLPMLSLSLKKKSLTEEMEKNLSYEDIVRNGDVTKEFRKLPILPTLLRRVLLYLEKESVFTEDSVKRIYGDLVEKLYPVLLDLINDKARKKKKVVVVFGAEENSKFLYPLEIRAFREFAIRKWRML